MIGFQILELERDIYDACRIAALYTLTVRAAQKRQQALHVAGIGCDGLLAQYR